jgi:hypothetical protein
MPAAFAPFAACEAALNAATQQHLANAVARFAGAPANVLVVFDAPAAEAALGLAGMASTRPAIGLPGAQVPAHPVGQGVTVDGRPYVVAECHPDAGTGWTVLQLEHAPA